MFKPLHDYILIEKPETDEKTPSGLLYIPETARERSSVATVLAVGPGKANPKGGRFPMHVKPGDKVLLTKFLGQDFTVNGKKVVLITQDNVISTLS